jgi:hypothetical protein
MLYAVRSGVLTYGRGHVRAPVSAQCNQSIFAQEPADFRRRWVPGSALRDAEALDFTCARDRSLAFLLPQLAFVKCVAPKSKTPIRCWADGSLALDRDLALGRLAVGVRAELVTPEPLPVALDINRSS